MRVRRESLPLLDGSIIATRVGPGAPIQEAKGQDRKRVFFEPRARRSLVPSERALEPEGGVRDSQAD